jgi:hypothetical protein
MPAKKYIVTLSENEKEILKGIIKKGKHSAEKHKRAQALLLAEKNYPDDMDSRTDRAEPEGAGAVAAAVCRGRI